MTKEKKNTPAQVWTQYEKGIAFKNGIDLYENVKNNENFFIGKQWEGVQSNGLPTPVFNFVRRIVLYLIASTASDNTKISATPLSSIGMNDRAEVEQVAQVINAQFEVLFEKNKMGKCLREFTRDAAVDGDGCIYTWFDPDVETGQPAKGGIRVEVLENTRVVFGNPNCREVEAQPYLIIAKREQVDAARRRAKANGNDPEAIRADGDETGNDMSARTDDMCTVLTKLWRDGKTGTIWATESTNTAAVRRPWDTGQKLYPIIWMPWDHVKNCYHGQAAVTGLLPNQVFINKMFAMVMVSLMTAAFPKIIYDKTRIAKWDARAGQAIGVNGGDMGTAARAIHPATISPQVGQFIELCIGLTKEFMGATDAALGTVRPDNTSAIIALQKASAVPLELVRQNLFQCVEDLGNIWLDLMRVYYGTRYVELTPTVAEVQMGIPESPRPMPFDFGVLDDIPLSLKLDVGGSAYWSEIAQMNTLDNLLMQRKISVEDYLERIPNGYIANKQELIDKLRSADAGGPPEREQSAVGQPGNPGVAGFLG